MYVLSTAKQLNIAREEGLNYDLNYYIWSKVICVYLQSTY